MTAPQRVQRRRTKGWRMPAGAVYVGRPTAWGNDYLVRRGIDGLWHVADVRALCPPLPEERGYATREAAARVAVTLYARDLGPGTPDDMPDLTGRDLACWCPLELPCHADVLLRLANPRPIEVLQTVGGCL